MKAKTLSLVRCCPPHPLDPPPWRQLSPVHVATSLCLERGGLSSLRDHPTGAPVTEPAGLQTGLAQGGSAVPVHRLHDTPSSLRTPLWGPVCHNEKEKKVQTKSPAGQVYTCAVVLEKCLGPSVQALRFCFLLCRPRTNRVSSGESLGPLSFGFIVRKI